MSESQKEWLLMVDGAARGNPGETGCGRAIYDATGAVVKELSRYLVMQPITLPNMKG